MVSSDACIQKSSLRRGWPTAGLALTALLCFGWILLVRLHTADEPLERDICSQILMGRVLADGGHLYVDTLEFKPPGMFVIWQIIHQTVGTGPAAVLWTNILVTLLTLWGVYLAGSSRPWGRGGGLWAMAFWALISGDMMLQANQPNNEVFINLFIAWGLACWLRSDSAHAVWKSCVAAGLFFAGATLIKPVLITVLVLALARIVTPGVQRTSFKGRLVMTGWMLLPVAVLWMLTAAYFIVQGRGEPFYNCLVRYGAYYARTGISGAPLDNVLRGTTDYFSIQATDFLWPLLALTLFGLAGAWLDRNRFPVVVLAGSLAATLLAVSVPGRFFPHYYQLYLPLLAIGAGWGVAAIANALHRWWLAAGVGLAALLLLFQHVAPDLQLDGSTWSLRKYPYLWTPGIFMKTKLCGQAVDALLKPDETVYVWGMDPGVYYYCHRRPASGIFWYDRMIDGPLKESATRSALGHLEKNQPALVLIENFLETPPDHPVVQWIKKYYAATPEMHMFPNFTAYVRRDSALAKRIANDQPAAAARPDPQ